MRVPKSVQESQRYVAWGFPVLLGYGAVVLTTASTHGRIAIVVSMAVIFTGWLSFGLVGESLYNDLLLVIDLALLVQYFAMLHASSALNASQSGVADVSLWAASASVFALYAAWDFAALLARDTRAVATALHLRRFGFICVAIAVLTGVAGTVIIDHDPGATWLSLSRSAVSRCVLLAIWGGVLIWWHWGRVRAALRDSEDAGA